MLELKLTNVSKRDPWKARWPIPVGALSFCFCHRKGLLLPCGYVPVDAAPLSSTLHDSVPVFPQVSQPILLFRRSMLQRKFAFVFVEFTYCWGDIHHATDLPAYSHCFYSPLITCECEYGNKYKSTVRNILPCLYDTVNRQIVLLYL